MSKKQILRTSDFRLPTLNTGKLNYQWYAIYTKSRNEKKVYQEIISKKIDAYLPLETKIRQWSDRKKKVREPMINSYVFVKCSEREYYDVLNINGVVRYVTFEGKAAPIPEWQIDAMKQVTNSSLHHHYSAERFGKGDQVQISEGPLCGYEGKVVRDTMGKQKVIIEISSIGYSMVIETPISTVDKTSEKVKQS